jgi:hypothetical protein
VRQFERIQRIGPYGDPERKDVGRVGILEEKGFKTIVFFPSRNLKPNGMLLPRRWKRRPSRSGNSQQAPCCSKQMLRHPPGSCQNCNGRHEATEADRTAMRPRFQDHRTKGRLPKPRHLGMVAAVAAGPPVAPKRLPHSERFAKTLHATPPTAEPTPERSACSQKDVCPFLGPGPSFLPRRIRVHLAANAERRKVEEERTRMPWMLAESLLRCAIC